MDVVEAVNALDSGGYLILRKEDEFLAFWSNPLDNEWESNRGKFKKQDITRCDGDTHRKFFWKHECKADALSALEQGWQVWRVFTYHRDLEDPPEGFEEVGYISSHGKGYKAYTSAGELVCVVPESSGLHLFSVCGIPVEFSIKI